MKKRIGWMPIVRGKAWPIWIDKHKNWLRSVIIGLGVFGDNKRHERSVRQAVKLLRVLEVTIIENYKKTLTREERMSLVAILGYECGVEANKKKEAEIEAKVWREAAEFVEKNVVASDSHGHRLVQRDKTDIQGICLGKWFRKKARAAEERANFENCGENKVR